jgi:hypothetical protein
MMRLILLYVIIAYVLTSFISCKKDPSDPTIPETGCHLKDQYVQDYHPLGQVKVFDLRNNPPKDINNDDLEDKLLNQWLFHHFEVPIPFPYSEYFFDSVTFLNPIVVRIGKLNSTDSKVYSYTRNDCGLELHNPDGDRHLELYHGGEDMIEQRFAIYEHHSRWIRYNSNHFKVDTFSFLEFRLGPFSTYEEIIQQFAIEHPGQYDTVAVELVQNKTKE